MFCACWRVYRSRCKPLGQGTVLLESEKAPSELDHAAPNASVTGARKAPLAPASSALIGGAGKAGVASDRLAVAPVAREDLVDQHVRRLNTDAEDARNETYHRVRAFLWGRCELAQVALFDRTDLFAHDA